MARVGTKSSVNVDGERSIVPVTNLSTPVWDKQPNEPFVAFDRFTLYRDIGPSRTYKQVAAELGRERGTIEDCAIRWRWKDRADAWDRHLDDIKTTAVEDAVKTMSNRQAKLGMMLQDKAVTVLETIDLTEATVRDAVQLADTGVKIERLARGEKTEEAAQVIIQIPMPSWAKNSPYAASAVPVPVPTPIEGTGTDPQPTNAPNSKA